MNFKNMSIKKSLIVGFGITILISAIIIVAELIMMNSQKNSYNDIIDRYVEATALIADCRIDYNIAARNLRDAALSGKTSSITTATNKLGELDAEFAHLKEVFPLEDRSTLDAFANAIDTWKADATAIAAVVATDRMKAVDMLVESCTPKLDAAASAGTAAAEALAKAQAEIIKRQELVSNIGIGIVIGVMVIATIVVILMAGRIIHRGALLPSAGRSGGLQSGRPGDPCHVQWEERAGRDVRCSADQPDGPECRDP